MDGKGTNLRLDGFDRLRQQEEAYAVRSGQDQTPAPDARGELAPTEPAIFEAAEIVASDIPTRDFRLGETFARRNVSSLIAAGGSGKTALRTAQALAMSYSIAPGPGITGEFVPGRSRILFVCFEDGEHELRRRVAAAMKHYGIKPEDLRGWLFLWAPSSKDGKLIEYDPETGRFVPGRLAETLRQLIKEKNIDVVILDPLVKLHSLNENDNSQMDELIQLLTDMAVEYDIAIDIPHHTSKGTSTPGDADRGRGASAVVSGARLVYTLSRMTAEEAKEFGISEERRRYYVRMDSAKVNIVPPGRKAVWFELRGVSIGNGGEEDGGDRVQVIVPWQPPGLLHGLDRDTQDRILIEIREGLEGGNRYSRKPGAKDRCVSKAFNMHAPEIEDTRARKIVARWINDGIVIEKKYKHPDRREEVLGLYVHSAWKPSGEDID